MTHGSGLQFTLELTGAETTDLAVIDFSLEEALSQPFTLKVRFASRDGSLSAGDLLDRPVTLILWQDGEVLRRINAIVSELGRGDRGHRHTHYSLVARPALWRLGLRQNYNRHRYYDPEPGRYISQDPIGLNGGTKLYQYASSPIMDLDPLGLSGVYGLGGGPYSQSNAVRRAETPQKLGTKSVAIGADPGVEVFGGIIGTFLSVGQHIDSLSGKSCTVTTACTKLGFGAYAGTGVDISEAMNDEAMKTGVTETWGPFIRGGTGIGAGA